MSTIFGDKLKELLKEKNMTAAELSRVTGLSQALISQYINNKFEPKSDKIFLIAEALGVSEAYLLGWEDLGDNFITLTGENDYQIPVLASVPCGEAYEAVENVIEELHINTNLYNKGVRYALIADGDSMYPKIEDGNTILIKPTPQVESGSIAIVKVNQHDATCKKVLINENGITLIPLNTNHEAVMYSMQEVLDLPVTIIGRVMEVRKEL